MPTIYLSPSTQEFNPYVNGGNEEYYMNLGTIVNDEHGIGIVIGAGVEVMNMLGE